MTVYQMLEKMLKSDLVTLLLGCAACLATAFIKRYVSGKKVRTFLPFILGLLLAFFYGLITDQAFTLLTPKRGIAAGTCATVYYVFYKRFFSEKNAKKRDEILGAAAAELIKDLSEGEPVQEAVKEAVLSVTERIEESVVISEKHAITLTEEEKQ